MTNEGNHMNTPEKCHICKENKKLNPINDKNTITENKIYDKIDKYETPEMYFT